MDVPTENPLPYVTSRRRSSRLYPRLSHLVSEEWHHYPTTLPSGQDGGDIDQPEILEDGDAATDAETEAAELRELQKTRTAWLALIDRCKNTTDVDPVIARVCLKVQEGIDEQGAYIKEKEEEVRQLQSEVQQLQQDLKISGQQTQTAGIELRQLEKDLSLEKQTVRNCQKLIGELTLKTRSFEQDAVPSVERQESAPREVRFSTPLEGETSAPISQTSHISTTHRSEKLPDPETFKDGTHQQYRSWERQMRDKLDINADRIGGQRQQLAYASSRIGGIAASFMEPWLDRNNRNRVTIVDEFFDKMQKRFGDPFSRETARAAFRKLYQGKKEFQEFLGEFYRLSVEGEYSEEEQLEELREKISIELKQAVVGFRPSSSSSSFRQFVEHLQWVDREQKSIKQSTNRMNNFKNRQQNNGNGIATSSSATSGEVTEIKKEERKTSTWNPKCYSCGKLGHISRDCTSGKEATLAKS